ncbi:MAG TPA: M1 family aminopeptidase [Chitinophagaceae bacterium]|nr:M1 family aminopeptidase [Chitinophagaceae bacterium]
MFLKNYPLFLISIYLLFSANTELQAQHSSPYYHGQNSIEKTASAGYNGTGANIDVKYHRCDWNINPNNAKNINGAVTTYFVTTQSNVSQITFDFNKVSFNNGSLSVLYHGASRSFSFPASGNVDVITITLPSPLASGVLDSVTINYDGAPPAAAGQELGYQKVGTGVGTYIYTLSESYEDRDWWPCKADMQDKIDSMDFNITVPWTGADTFWVATNGKLIDSAITASNRTFRFKHRYPIASYLVSVAVGRFNRYYRGDVNISGTDVPVVYNILRGKSAATYTSMLTAMDRSKQMLVELSNKFGDYPFKNEKHGYYEFGFGGGMEHQTFSGMSAGAMTSNTVICHELAHQWFGDKVTFATWNDLWLAEGFARYSEALIGELMPSLGINPVTTRSGFRTTARNTTNRAYAAYIPNSSMGNSDLIWGTPYGSTVYERGAMALSMLRTLVGDNLFFQACQNYMNDPVLAYNAATTNDLKAHFQAVLGGKDLSPFFDSYVMNGGYPTYTINWGKNGNQLVVQVASQATTSAPSGSFYYKTPIALRVQGSIPAQDTVIVIYDENGMLSNAGNGIINTVAGNTISTTLSFSPVTVTFDPYFQTLAGGTVNFLSVLDTKVIDFVIRQNGNSNELNLSVTADDQITVILQKSKDGISFADAGQMTFINTTGGNTGNYSFVDRDPFATGTFYKAKISGPGYEKYTKILTDNRMLLTGLSVYPNPADKNISISWNVTGANAGGELILVAMDGQKVKTLKTGTNKVSLSVADLPSGVYILELRNEGVLVSRKNIVVRR